MSLLIKGVQVVDGEGNEPYKADVLVQRNTISAIGNLKKRETDVVIDGLGHYLAPGFIDVHTNADHYLSLFSNPSQDDFVSQGITSIIGGHCGASLAPLLYGRLESVRKWVDPHDINVDWHSVAELLTSLNKVSPGVNFGTLVGHSTVRRALVGERARLSGREADVLAGILREAVKEGAFGLSAGLGYVHGKRASKNELRQLVAVLGETGGIYAVHLRNETDKLVESVREVIELSRKSNVPTVISHLMPVQKFEKQYEEALSLIEDASGNLHFDIYPYATSVRAVYTLLPEWTQVENLEAMLERVGNEETAKLIAKDLKGIAAERIRIAGAPHHGYLVGKTLRDLADNLGVSAPRALLHLMKITRLRATVFNDNINEKLLEKAVLHERALIASHGSGALPGEFIKHERSLRSFPKYFDMAVRQSGFSVAHAVEKVTSKPAKLLGLSRRGVVKEGNIADLVVLGKNDYEIKHVVLGGKVFGQEPTKGEMLRFNR